MNGTECSLEEQRAALHEQDLQRIKSFRLMDDDFLSVFFRDNIKDTEFILRIILGQPELKVKSVHAQHELKNLNGRSVRLDVHAVMEDGTEADDMYYPQLAEKMRYLKKSERGVEGMCKVMEDMRNDVRIDIALNMIAKNKLTLEDIAECAELPLEKVRELAEKRSA